MGKKVVTHIVRKGISVLNTLLLRDSDVMLASFPKSGNTWMRFLLSNIIARHTNTVDSIDFYSIQNIIPDIHRVVLSARHRYEPFPRIVKTHHPRRPEYRQVIYLARNPEKVMLSYYVLLRTVGKIPEMPLSRFIRSERYGLPVWIRHALGYIDSADLLISYDSLQENPVAALQTVADYFGRFHGIPISSEDIRGAIRESSLENMRIIENTKGRPYQRSGYNFVRPRKGRQAIMQSEDKAYIREELHNHEALIELFTDSSHLVA